MKCGIIKDLLPSYIDGLTSEDSNQAIEEHLETCDKCKAYYVAMWSGESLEEFIGESTKEGNQTEGCHKTKGSENKLVAIEDKKDLQVLKSFKRKRRSLIALTSACVAAVVAVVMCLVVNAYFAIPYEKVQPQVEISEDLTSTTYWTRVGERVYYWRGMYYFYELDEINSVVKNCEVHKVTMDGEEKTVILMSVRAPLPAYLNSMVRLGGETYPTAARGHWPGSDEIDDFDEVDYVYYIDRNVERTIRMSEEQVLDWIEKYGHLVWSKE